MGTFRTSLATLVCALALATTAEAQDKTFHYKMKGRYGTFGPRFDSTLTTKKRADGRYDVTRSWQYRKSGDAAPRLTGIADVTVRNERYRANGRTRTRKVVRIKVVFSEKKGAATALAEVAGGSVDAKELSGNYRIRGDRAEGWTEVRGRDNKIKRVYERGDRTNDPVDYGDMVAPGSTDGTTGPGGTTDGTDGEPTDGTDGTTTDGTTTDGTTTDGATTDGTDASTDLQIVTPQPGVYLAGQLMDVTANKDGAAPRVLSGPATIRGGRLALTGAGAVKLSVSLDGKSSEAVEIEVVEAQIVAITVEETVEMEDAKPPHFKRDLDTERDAHAWEPAAIYMNSQLKLKVTIRATKDLSSPTRVTLKGEAGRVDFEGQGDVQSLAKGQEIGVISGGVLADGVKVNEVLIGWRLDAGQSQPLTPMTPLRVYTTFAAPVDNPLPRYGPTSRQGLPLTSKLHFELACTWAQGAKRNNGQGIAYKIDNALRHHVAWKDYGNNVPVVPHYPRNRKAPINYGDLPSDTFGGKGRVRNGRRAVSPLYYPPLEVKKEYENYSNYRNNFGWWLLDNPKYTGGRCNQQASLICDVVGTLGLKAEVYYIERVARGRVSGRPMRRYYKSSRSNKTWNFHGQAQVIMEDDSAWLYDGSGSWPPNRINGRVEDLMKVPGTYVDKWMPWKYDDGGSYAPMEEWPDTWQGVPQQPGEEELKRDAPDGTYAFYVGDGKMSTGKTIKFYAINQAGHFVYKVDRKALDAETYTEATHGKIDKWLGRR